MWAKSQFYFTCIVGLSNWANNLFDLFIYVRMFPVELPYLVIIFTLVLEKESEERRERHSVESKGEAHSVFNVVRTQEKKDIKKKK